jgi:hypothetical protein
MVSKTSVPKLKALEGDASDTCRDCGGSYWVCEEHPDRQIDHDGCGGAGMPCPWCNTASAIPEITSDLVVELILDDCWRTADEVSFEISERRRVRTRTALNLMPSEGHCQRKTRPRYR